MNKKLILKYSNPETIILANKGEFFYRNGDSYYLISSSSVKQLSLLKKTFIFTSIYKNFPLAKSLKEYEIGFANPEELWIKIGSGKTKKGWRYLGAKSPTFSLPTNQIPAGMGVIFVTYE